MKELFYPCEEEIPTLSSPEFCLEVLYQNQDQLSQGTKLKIDEACRVLISILLYLLRGSQNCAQFHSFLELVGSLLKNSKGLQFPAAQSLSFTTMYQGKKVKVDLEPLEEGNSGQAFFENHMPEVSFQEAEHLFDSTLLSEEQGPRIKACNNPLSRTTAPDPPSSDLSFFELMKEEAPSEVIISMENMPNMSRHRETETMTSNLRATFPDLIAAVREQGLGINMFLKLYYDHSRFDCAGIDSRVVSSSAHSRVRCFLPDS